MKLHDMAMTKKEKKERNEPCGLSKSSGPDYPYGLSITLDNEALTKLNMGSLPTVGSMVTVQAQARVISVRSNERDGGKKDRSMELQLQRIGVTKGGASSAEEALSEAVDNA